MYCSNCGSQLLEGANYCTGCGGSISITSSSNIDSTTQNIEIEKILYATKGVSIEFVGNRFSYLEDEFCSAVGAKNILQLLVDVLITTRRIVVVPGVKNKSDIAFLGLAFGGAATIAVPALKAAASLWAEKSSRSISVEDRLKANNMLEICAVWNLDTTIFNVFETRTSWGLFGGEWVTFPRLYGPCTYKSEIFESGFELAFSGRTRDRDTQKQENGITALMEIFKFDPKNIRVRTIDRKRGE